MKQKIDRTALMCATDLLERQDQSEARLRQKLTVRKYSKEEIDDAIEKLKKYNYLDDERACSNQFEVMYKSERYSMQQILYKLITMGFERQLVESFKPEDFSDHDEIVAIKFLRSKFKTLPEDKKMLQFLSTKGFDYSTVERAIEKFKNSFEENE